MEPLQLALTIGSAFISATSVLIASVALGARWEGRSESDRLRAEAKDYEARVTRSPQVQEVRYLEALLHAYESAHKPVEKDLERREQLVRHAESNAETRARNVQAYLETLGDARRVAERLRAHDHPGGIRGALRSARRRLARPSGAGRPAGPAPRAGKGAHR